MNVTSICIAALIACLFAPTTVLAQTDALHIAASSAAVSSTVSVSVAGLSGVSTSAMPGYPLKAYRDGYRHGRVVLGYTINADGTVGDVQVLDAFPVQVFTRTASNAVAAWRFAPTGTSERRTVEFRFAAE